MLSAAGRRSLERFRHGLELGRELGYREQIVYFLEGLAAAHAAEGDHERAAKLLGAAGPAAAEMGMTLELDEAVAYALTARGPRLPPGGGVRFGPA